MYLYILYNEKIDKYYIGCTNDYLRREKEHNKKSNQGFTGKYVEGWKVIFTRKFDLDIDARKEERRLKKAKNKKYLKWYIENFKGR